VTPFKEFIPSLEKRYWIRGGLPRVLTTDELREFVQEISVAGGSGPLWNEIELHD
jgi:hypothetical protein